MLKSVPPNSTVVGVPAKVVVLNGKRVNKLDHADVPDPCAQQVAKLVERIQELENKIDHLQEQIDNQKLNAL